MMGSPIGIVNTRIARASLEVPSVPFDPGMDLYGQMLSEHRQEDNEHSKEKLFLER